MITFWQQKTSVPYPLNSHLPSASTATLGYVFTTTGTGGVNANKIAWSFDPVANVWAQLTSTGAGAYSIYGGAAVAVFTIGSIIYIGGGYASGASADFWQFDTSTNSWTHLANMPEGLFNGAGVTAVSDGSYGYVLFSSNNFRQYQPGVGWSALPAFTGNLTAAYTMFIVGSTIFCIDSANVVYKYIIGSGGWVNTGATSPKSMTSGVFSFTIGALGYIYYDVDGSYYSFNPSNNTFTVSNPYPGTAKGGTYYWPSGFSIGSKGYLGAGAGFSDFWEWVQQLSTPTGLAAVANSLTSVTLNWTDNETVETGYIVERKRSDQTSYSQLATTGPFSGSGTYIDNTVDLSTYSYWYRVKAFQV